jgi:hypothetical protein
MNGNMTGRWNGFGDAIVFAHRFRDEDRFFRGSRARCPVTGVSVSKKHSAV